VAPAALPPALNGPQASMSLVMFSLEHFSEKGGEVRDGCLSRNLTHKERLYNLPLHGYVDLFTTYAILNVLYASSMHDSYPYAGDFDFASAFRCPPFLSDRRLASLSVAV